MTELDTSIFLTQEKFFAAIEEYIKENDASYIEATIRTCEKFMVDLEDVHKLKLISPVLKDKLRIEGMDDGYLKRESQLPI
jgi:hypothetical protein